MLLSLYSVRKPMGDKKQKVTERASIAVQLNTRIREVLGSSLG
jgi:hypothetical protein